MSRRYYCELCDKRFADNPQSRRNHIRGVVHQSLRKQHYDSFKDPAELLAEERLKKPCRTFCQTGDCRFGGNCRFSHMTSEEFQELEHKVLLKRDRRNQDEKEPTLEDWLRKRKKKSCDKNTETKEEETEKKEIEQEHFLPQIFHGVPNIPISILPGPPGCTVNLPIEEWG